MSEAHVLHYWEVWYPRSGATGLLVGRGLIDPMDTLLLHAAPEVLSVEVYTSTGVRLASGQDLERTLQSPICRLRRNGNKIDREDIWPTQEDLGQLVLLPGGEVGTLKTWWHADDYKEWRWQVEFYNSLR